MAGPLVFQRVPVSITPLGLFFFSTRNQLAYFNRNLCINFEAKLRLSTPRLVDAHTCTGPYLEVDFIALLEKYIVWIFKIGFTYI